MRIWTDAVETNRLFGLKREWEFAKVHRISRVIFMMMAFAEQAINVDGKLSV